MAFEDDLFDVGLNAFAGEIDEISLHEAEPSSGSDEVSGGSYARQTPTWSPAENGSVSTDGNITFDVPGGSTVAWVGLWGSEGNPWYGAIATDETESFGADGQFTLTAVTITMVNETS